MAAGDEGKAPWDPKTERPDVAVLVALKEETLALREVVGGQAFFARRNAAFAGHDYLLLASNEHGRAYRVVLYFMDDMGPAAAAAATHRLLEMGPRLVVNIGIACSLHAGDLPLCSVLVASQVDGYDERSKAHDDGKEGWTWTFGGKVYSPTEQWGRIAGDLAVSHPERFEQWQGQCASDFAALVDRARDGKKLDALRRKRFLPEHPVLQRGHLATGVSVAAAAAFKKKVLGRDRNIKALEMEAAGMLRAAQERLPPVDTLVLKGVSDLGDAGKQRVDGIGPGAIRKAAMRNAVRLLWALMRAGELPQVEDGPRGARAGSAPERVPVNDAELVDELAKLFGEDMAEVLLEAIGFPKGQRPRFGMPLGFWTKVVGDVRGGVVEGDGVQALIDAAAKHRPGNEFLARHRVVASDPPPPTGVDVAAERDEWKHSLVVEIARRIDEESGLRECLGQGSKQWSTAAVNGTKSLATALVFARSTAELVDGLGEAMRRLAGPRALARASVMLEVLDLALPAVAGMCMSMHRDGDGHWIINTDHLWMAEAQMAHEDQRPLEWLPAAQKTAITHPRAYIDIRTPEGGASLEQRARDVELAMRDRLFAVAKKFLDDRDPMKTHADYDELEGPGARDRLIDDAADVLSRGFSASDISRSLTYFTILLDRADRAIAPRIVREIGHRLGIRVLCPRLQKDDEVAVRKFKTGFLMLVEIYKAIVDRSKK